MFPEKETLTVEFKSDRARLSNGDLMDVVVGFANTHGGTLYVGIEDDGRVTGAQADHLDPIGVSALIANHTIPPQSVRAKVLGDHADVLAIEVFPSPSIVSTASGKVLRRRLKADGTPETVPMYPHEYVTRLSDLTRLDFSAQAIPEASTDDFDPLERERLRTLIRANRGEAALLELSDEELDRALLYVKREGDRYVPTLTGLLMIGREEAIRRHIPTAGLSFQVLQNSEVRVNETFQKGILATFESALEYFKAWNSEREIAMGLLSMRIPDFDHQAFREALVNAFAHRNYGEMHRVRIQIDDDGMLIASPGGFIEGITVENLLTAEPRSRNPALADALKRIGLAERTGRGIDRIYQGALTYGRPLPDYSDSNSKFVRLFIQRANPDEKFTRVVAEAMQKPSLGQNVFSLMVLYTLRHERRASLDELAEKAHVEKSRIKAVVDRLTDAGYLEASGNARGRTYMLSAGIHRALNETVQHVRQTDIDRIRYPELILKLARKQGSIRRNDVMELLHLTGPQAYKQLKHLVDSGLLEMQGDRTTATYTIPK